MLPLRQFARLAPARTIRRDRSVLAAELARSRFAGIIVAAALAPPCWTSRPTAPGPAVALDAVRSCGYRQGCVDTEPASPQPRLGGAAAHRLHHPSVPPRVRRLRRRRRRLRPRASLSSRTRRPTDRSPLPRAAPKATPSHRARRARRDRAAPCRPAPSAMQRDADAASRAGPASAGARPPHRAGGASTRPFVAGRRRFVLGRARIARRQGEFDLLVARAGESVYARSPDNRPRELAIADTAGRVGVHGTARYATAMSGPAGARPVSAATLPGCRNDGGARRDTTTGGRVDAPRSRARAAAAARRRGRRQASRDALSGTLPRAATSPFVARPQRDAAARPGFALPDVHDRASERTWRVAARDASLDVHVVSTAATPAGGRRSPQATSSGRRARIAPSCASPRRFCRRPGRPIAAAAPSLLTHRPRLAKSTALAIATANRGEPAGARSVVTLVCRGGSSRIAARRAGAARSASRRALAWHPSKTC